MPVQASGKQKPDGLVIMRRSRFSGWHDEAPTTKQAEPLRHRISRTEKALDNLDKLDRELRSTRMDCEDKEHLERLLAVQRAKLAEKLNRELGISQAKPARPSKAPRSPAKPVYRRTRYHRRPLLSNGCKWLIFVAVMAAIFF